MHTPPRTTPPLSPPVTIGLTVTGEQPCPYLPDQVAQNRAFLARRMDPEMYHAFMDAGFRRSGTFIYQPACPSCSACRPIRVPTDGFVPTTSQRRTLRRNQDLAIAVAPARPSPEKFDLYARYASQWHGSQDTEWDGFVSFLYDSPVDTVEFTYRDAAGRLVGVGICDICSRSLSSVYFYFDPAAARRGLGTFSILREIEFARERGIRFYYLGYWIDGCGSMSYKARFGPHQVLDAGGVWRDGNIVRCAGQ